MNRAGPAGGSNSRVDWSHYEQDNEQVLPGGSRARSANGSRQSGSARIALAGDRLGGCEDRTLREHVERLGQEGRGGQRAARWHLKRHGREDEGARAGEPGAAPGERDPPQGGSMFYRGGVRPSVETMVSFTDAHRAEHGVEPICKVLPIAPSTNDDHLLKRAEPARRSAHARRGAALRPEIHRVFDENWQVYGVRKVWRQLGREGIAVALCMVAGPMKDMGLQGIIRGKPHRTTIPDKTAPCPMDKKTRGFRVPAPDML